MKALGRWSVLCVTVVAASSAMAVRQCQAAINLPAPGGGLSETNGNFEVYSLPFLENFFGGGFNVQSSPGQIQDGIVIMTGANGMPVNNNPAGMDDAYPTPNTSPIYFDTNDVADPSDGPTSGPDASTRWDADVSAIRSFLEPMGGDFVIFYNLNEQNAADGQGLFNAQDELGWAQVDLIDTNGGLPTLTFFLSAADDPLTVANEHTAGLTASQISGGPDPDPTSNPTGTSVPTLDARWSYIHGIITVGPDNSFLHYGPLLPGDPAGSSEINQNLGADRAAFAIYNEQLSNLIKDPNSGYELLSADIRLSRINNGYEQAFILPMTIIGNGGVIPEATSFATWLGLSFVATGFASRRREQAQA